MGSQITSSSWTSSSLTSGIDARLDETSISCRYVTYSAFRFAQCPGVAGVQGIATSRIAMVDDLRLCCNCCLGGVLSGESANVTLLRAGRGGGGGGADFGGGGGVGNDIDGDAPGVSSSPAHSQGLTPVCAYCCGLGRPRHCQSRSPGRSTVRTENQRFSIKLRTFEYWLSAAKRRRIQKDQRQKRLFHFTVRSRRLKSITSI